MRKADSASALEQSGSGYSWFILAVLCLASVISFVDRQVINLLVDPIKADMGLSDTEISLLQGFAFAVFYSLAAIPLGRAVDVKSRKTILVVGMTLWSIATAACGAAKSFGQLFVARMFVGVGEATLFPGGFSMIADYFPRKSLTRALSIFNSSTFFGAGFALIIGGQIYSQIEGLGEVSIPLLGVTRAWQLTFIAVAIPGLFLALIMMFTVREPKRTGTASDDVNRRYTLRDGWRHLLDNKSVLAPIIVGTSLVAMSMYSIAAWTPSFFIRVHGMTPAEIGNIFGTYFVVFGVSGVVSGGVLADWLRARGHYDSNIRAGLISAACVIPFIVLFPLVEDKQLSLMLLAPVIFFGTMPYGTGPTALPLLVPNRLRGQVMGVYILIVNLVGQGFGPWLLALYTDYVVGDAMKVGVSISVVCSLAFIAVAAVFAVGMRPYRNHIVTQEQINSQPS